MCRSAGKTRAPCELAPSWPVGRLLYVNPMVVGSDSALRFVKKFREGRLGFGHAFEVPMASFLSKTNIKSLAKT